MKSRNIKMAIMRRVYYSYLLSIITNAMFWQGMFLGVATLLLGQWLHVASIIHNMLAVPVGRVPQYVYGSVWGAVSHGEVLMVLTFMAAGIVAVSAGYHIAQSTLGKVVWLERA